MPSDFIEGKKLEEVKILKGGEILRFNLLTFYIPNH